MEQFEACGAAVIALCPQLPEFNAAATHELGLTFPVLQDRNNTLASMLKLTLSTPPNVIEAERFLGLDLPAHNGTDHWDLPIPARFAVDLEFAVQYAAIHIDHRMRKDPLECLKLLQENSAF